MIPVIVGVACLALGGLVALIRVPTEFGEKGRLSTLTFVAVFIAFAGPVLATLAAAWFGHWPLAIPSMIAWIVGGGLILAGAALHLVARAQFRSFRLIWGLSSDRLITNGVYRYSRNPQLVGWILVLLGAAILGRSGAALLLAVLFWASCLIYVPVEERFLERRYGSAYKEFKAAVPRYFGMPRQTKP